MLSTNGPVLLEYTDLEEGEEDTFIDVIDVIQPFEVMKISFHALKVTHGPQMI